MIPETVTHYYALYDEEKHHKQILIWAPASEIILNYCCSFNALILADARRERQNWNLLVMFESVKISDITTFHGNKK